MTPKRDLAAELDALKKDIASLRQAPVEIGRPHLASAITAELGELRGLVEDMLEDAETGVNEHPVATVAGALALGILIGRMTAR
jgi:ElaB/YqjD/DUF883 family membrane-anchored ribosome-binding protein